MTPGEQQHVSAQELAEAVWQHPTKKNGSGDAYDRLMAKLDQISARLEHLDATLGRIIAANIHG